MEEQLEALTAGMARQVASWLPTVTPERHPEPLLEGARRAADFWVAIHRAALAGEARP
ncbi:hypothetical protein HMI51_26780 [Corallococcus coralloides]|nr:hypothetical protein [Corallococcus coralloides]